MGSRLILTLVALLTFVAVLHHKTDAFSQADILKRFEYKISFKGPHLVFKDGTIPFWEHSGSSIASNDQIRITPSIKSQKGRIWSKNTMTSQDWEIEVLLRVSGRGRVGADGMAIWYTDRIGTDGPVFGSNDNWHGLGVFLDSFDNDALQNNPYIMIMTNDGTKTYDHHRDGVTQQLGGCMRDFRNKPFPIRLKIEYYKKALTIYYHSGLNNDLTNYEICSRIENVELPNNGHFGVSAATGGLADDHDVLAFITHSLIDRSAPDTNTPTSEEQLKYDHEYEEFMKKMEAEKESYNKEHPEKAAEELEEKKMGGFEGENDRQFRTILDLQNSLQHSMRTLETKLSEIAGRQEGIVSMLSANNVNNAGQRGQPPPQINQFGDSFKREEINLLMAQQGELVRATRDIHAMMTEVNRKTAQLVTDNSAGSATKSNVQADQHNQQTLQQINDGVKNFRFEMANLLSKQPQCPEATSCLSSTYFLVIIIMQSVVYLMYTVYKSRSDSQAKKFY